MSIAGFVVGFGFFDSALELEDVASLLSTHVFGGIQFVEKETDDEYRQGILKLANLFLGIHVELFGENGSYALEMTSHTAASIEQGDCDLSLILKHFLMRVGQFVNVTP